MHAVSPNVRPTLPACLCAAWLLLVTASGVWTEVHRIRTPLAAWLARATDLLTPGRGQ